ncbi:MAG TPA: mechanosensitive ion channel family protein [Leptospiraceae bacterium]|nr:mechanosensitive ion channel family protein [Leptospiraceae bacterium]HMW04226.1 mechanosensitive ion channel family protein [Leptospiraceae bacterium]HMX34309.1 mechanosensitive ion channel family protein [Leptospiraceae bacterium]HMY31272.1 mechanosensitive ion channel family protein [Leptospiraceae bacterium]HMZ63385.1 mechanosensitive ion channel family protein [Leptospiraceae bacterium]
MFFRFCFLIFISIVSANAENPLSPLKLDSPRETMKMFLSSMNEYKKGVEKNDESKKLAIEKSIKCLDLSEIAPLVREEKGKETAIFLKEAIDRVYVLELEKIPETAVDKWSIPDTEITITKITSGNRSGEYVFTAETVASASEYYRKTSHMPYLAKTGGGAAYSLPWLETIFPKWAREKWGFFFIWQWLGLLVATIISFLLKYVSKFFFRLAIKLTRNTSTRWDDFILTTLARPVAYFFSIAYWFSFLYLSGIEGKIFTTFNFILKVCLGLNFIYFLYKLSDLAVDLLKDNSVRTKNPIDDKLIPLMSKTLRILFVTVGFLIALQNIGVNVVGLIAGLGIGGLALALAAKDTAANLFGSVMIFMDKPFKIDDHIIINGKEGIVEDIGFRSTLIRTWEDSLVTIPNSVVANADIENMGVRRWRRNVINIDVTYDTNPEKMEAFLEGIKEIIMKNPLIVADTVHIGFRDFGASSLVIYLQFCLAVDSLPKNLEGRQLILLDVMRLAKEVGITFAYPTTSLYVESLPDKKQKQEKEKTITTFKNIIANFGKDGKLSKPKGAGIFVSPYHDLPETK